MPFISAAQTTLLATRIIAAAPSVKTEDAQNIAQAICDWFEQDAIPQIMVLPGIATSPAILATPGNTTAPGQIL